MTKEKKIGTKFDESEIEKVAKKSYREALLKRLAEFDGDPKKAFGGKNSPAKNPILDEKGNKLPEKVKLVEKEQRYTKREEINKDLKVEKVVDVRIKKILQTRLQEFGGDPKKAFVNLEENPIWLNEEKGIAIKRVTIKGVNDAVPLGTKKDHLGDEIRDKNGETIKTSFVQTGNNHHVAIYEDEKGNWQEEVVTFWEAVERARQGEPVVKTIHEEKGIFLFSMAINDYFIFGDDGFDPLEIDLKNPKNRHLISPHLFRVQKVSIKNYVFRHHLETTTDREYIKDEKGKKTNAKNKKMENVTYFLIQSLPSSAKNKKNKEDHPLSKVIKVRLDRLGNIVEVIYPKDA